MFIINSINAVIFGTPLW